MREITYNARKNGQVMTTENAIQIKLAETVLRQGELKLQAQLSIALAADSRAGSFASLFMTLALVSFGAAGALWKLGAGWVSLLVGACVETLLLLICAYWCVEAASPVNFYTVGNRPNNWWEDGVSNKPLEECLKKESENYNRRIEHNSEVLNGNARAFNYALWGGILSPVVSGTVAVLVRTCLV